MLKKILFPTISSKNSNIALEYVINLAKKFDAEVVVLVAYNLSFSFAESSMNYYLTETQLNDISSDFNRILEEISDKLKSEGIKVKAILKKGDTAEAIIDTINEETCDLVVLSSRVTSILRSLITGSISNYVLHHTDCPVLVVH
jgi:nucleotide-binding universal stress UspA family protein